MSYHYEFNSQQLAASYLPDKTGAKFDIPLPAAIAVDENHLVHVSMINLDTGQPVKTLISLPHQFFVITISLYDLKLSRGNGRHDHGRHTLVIVFGK